MEEGRPSAMAVVAALMRAAHLLLDDEPKILRDDLALGLSGVETEAALRAALDALLAEIGQKTAPAFAHSLFRYSRAQVAWRSRYAEDELEKACQRGVAQYVILGAGLDSFAYRCPELASGLHVFEVDHPATQQWKRSRLRELNIPLPGNLTFVPLDFEQQTLAEELHAGGLRSELPTFFSWLGVTPYLTEAAVFEPLRYVASLAPGSEIVFEYGMLDSLLDEENRQLAAAVKATVADRGEPALSLFEPVTLAARVKELGFAQVWDVGPKEANARYFAGRTDGLCAWSLTHLMKAQT